MSKSLCSLHHRILILAIPCQQYTTSGYPSVDLAVKHRQEWQPQIETPVDIVKLEVGKLSKHWDRSIEDQAAAGLGIFPIPMATFERPIAIDQAGSPAGHCINPSHRDVAFGSITIFTHVW
jgi:hypothetical protein